MRVRKIAFAADHGGVLLKDKLIEFVLRKMPDIEITDLGTHGEESVDYPIFGRLCAEEVVSGRVDRGVVCCGTGIGISIAANKVRGARCALCTSVELAEMTRRHNDANMIAFGGRTTSAEAAEQMLEVFLTTEFEGGRHQRRIDMLE